MHDGATHAGNYNHAITGLMLGEIYGMTADRRQEQIGDAIEKGIKFLRQQQIKPKRAAQDKGGW